MENSTVQLKTRWRLRLGSAGGEHYLFFPLVHDFLLSDAIATLVEFQVAQGNIDEIEPKREYSKSSS